ncbi:MAG: DNA-directed RNA polymerase subunit omega [Kiritimatiellaeota bacterium]|nr:DNA-directed RNA polymerase subunit omega [Kiritimatiellota bacterium]
MNLELLNQARTRISSIPVLVNVVSMRVKQLNDGQRPLVKPLAHDEDRMDIVLREIGEGKLVAQQDFDAIARRG